MRSPAALAVAALLVGGCGGAEPAPQVPVAPAPAPVDPNAPASEPACNEVFLGIMELATAADSTAGGTRSTAAIIRRAQIASAAFAELRASLQRAVALDTSLAPQVKELEAALAVPIDTLDTGVKAQETHAKQMRELSGEIERLRQYFGALCKPKEPDCMGKAQVLVSLSLVDFSAATMPRTRGEIAKAELVTPEAQAKRTELLRKLEEAERSIAEQQKQLQTITAAASDAKAGAVEGALEKLGARCGGMKDDARLLAAVRRPQWVTTKDPDLRKMVVVIRVVPEGRIRARLDEWAQVSNGLRREAFEAATRGGFGSGFFVVPRAGEAYVVTNRHVVDFGDRANVQLPDGTVVAADIVYTDPQADIAVLKPLKPTVTAGLALDPEAAKDHQVVIATGYPGMDGRPSYQTTRGHVSNQRYVDAWDKATYIQHTAPIDKGNSGGPLTSERFSVLGVNTLKYHERENVAMAVPATAVAEAVARADAKVDTESLQKDARAACLDIVAELSAPKPNIYALYRRISLSMVAESGSTSFNSQASRDRELGEMLLDAPIDALRAAIVDRLLVEARVARINPYETCASPEPDDWQHIQTMDRVRFHLRVGAENKDLVLRREHGRFQLLRLDLMPPSDTPPAAKKPGVKKPGAKKPAAK